jgi:hypothetical protein
MVKTWVFTDTDGNIVSASTTDPALVQNGIVPDYQYEFDLTWDQIDDLWRYKVVDGQLVMK